MVRAGEIEWKPECAPADELAGIDWSQVLSDREPYRVKHDSEREVLRIPGENGEPGIFLKIFRASKPQEKLFWRLGFSRAAREYRVARHCLNNQIPSAAPLGFTIIGNEQIFASSEIQNAKTLTEVIAQQEVPELSKQLLSTYGELLAKVNLQGRYFDDYYGDNVLVQLHAGGAHACFLIDNEKTRPFTGWFSHWRMKNLVTCLFFSHRHNLNQTERETVLCSYQRTVLGREPTSAELKNFEARLQKYELRNERRKKRRHERRQKKQAQQSA